VGSSGGLSDKQRAFIAEYLIDLNATQAAIRAGYSKRTARAAGHKLLCNPAVADAVAAAQAERSERTEITADRVLQELAALAFLDPAQIAAANIKSPDGIAALPEGVRRAVTGWSYDRNEHFTLKLGDKLGALKLIGDHLGMFKDGGATLTVGSFVIASEPMPESADAWLDKHAPKIPD
jgi:phage terminase small subunit